MNQEERMLSLTHVNTNKKQIKNTDFSLFFNFKSFSQIIKQMWFL